MIGITKIAKGRMGNRLFHYHFLRQVAEEAGLAYFHPNFPDSKYFKEMERKARPFSLFRKELVLTSKEVLGFKQNEFIEFIKKENSSDKEIIINPPMLGEVFFDYLFYTPAQFIRMKDEFKLDFNFSTKDKTVVGLHFRGTDFKAWNERASLKFEYYRSAIDFCLQEFKTENLIFVIFSDDFQFDTFTKTIEYLKYIKAKFNIGDNKRPAIYDFYQISQCDVLVSSPSTFAIFAGILGKKKKIIHAKSWIDYAVANGDIFWVKLYQGGSQYYKLWKFF